MLGQIGVDLKFSQARRHRIEVDEHFHGPTRRRQHDLGKIDLDFPAVKISPQFELEGSGCTLSGKVILVAFGI